MFVLEAYCDKHYSTDDRCNRVKCANKAKLTLGISDKRYN